LVLGSWFWVVDIYPVKSLLTVDGAYHSVGNQDYAKENKTAMILSGMQGKKGKYKHQSWAFCRGLWLNLVRIRNYLS